MPKWQEYVGSTVPERWSAANEWLEAAKTEDESFHITGIYTNPANEFGDARLVIEFNSARVRNEIFEL